MKSVVSPMARPLLVSSLETRHTICDALERAGALYDFAVGVDSIHDLAACAHPAASLVCAQ